jgi:CpeT protein
MKFLWALCSIFATACAANADVTPQLTQTDAERFAAQASGSWSSRAQSTSPDYDWVESEVRVLKSDKASGVWLYQENAIMAADASDTPSKDAKDRPYFQVIIQLRDLGQGRVHTTTYRLETPEAKAAAKLIWREGKAFDFALLGGVACMGSMTEVGQGYWRGETECPNGYKGGVKVDSQSIRTPDTFVNWDRGFDASGKQVWGPAKGGYVFNRKGS